MPEQTTMPLPTNPPMINLNEELIPPPDIVRDGSSSLANYISTGAHFADLFKTYLPLRHDSAVLEIGSATGRMSRQFTPLLSARGRFTGVEIMPAQVAWCRERITGRFPNFQFVHADIYNTEYNPGGGIKASSYVFPCGDSEVDIVILTSVFTHMLRQDVAHYLMEIQRVLKPGGFCFATFYLYAREELSGIYADAATPKFNYPIYKGADNMPLVVCANNQCLEEAVAYEKNFIETMYAQAELAVSNYLPGNWLKRAVPCFSSQDVLIARKSPAQSGDV